MTHITTHFLHGHCTLPHLHMDSILVDRELWHVNGLRVPPSLSHPLWQNPRRLPSLAINALKNNIILWWYASVQHPMRGHIGYGIGSRDTGVDLEMQLIKRLCLWLRSCTRYGVVKSSGIELSWDYIANTTTHQCYFTNNPEGFAKWRYNYPTDRTLFTTRPK